MRTIKSAFRLALIAASALLVPQAASRAQQQPTTTAVANIPFAFQIGSYHYRAGKYTLDLQGDHVLILHGDAGSGLMQVNWDTAKRPSAIGELVFHRYGDQYFLRQMRLRGSSEFLISPQSKQERSAQKEEVEAERSSGPLQEPRVQVALVEARK
jgi:hypothetical protein